MDWAYEHESVSHKAGEYVRGDVHTNTIENFWSMLKRGILGIYHHCSPKHLHRYVDEFAFRYNGRKVNDDDRTLAALSCVAGKRLMYRTPKKETTDVLTS